MYQSANLRFRLPLLALGLGLLIGTASCNKDKDNTPDDTELVTNADDQATAENDDATVADMVEMDAPTEANASRALPADSITSSATNRGGCATRTWDPATRTLTIDFGTSNCLCRDGRFRRGKIQAVFTGMRYTPGSTVTITRQNYFVNDNQHLGTKVITFTNYNQWHVHVTNAQVIFSAANGGGTKTWSCDRDVSRTAAPGVPTTFTVTGAAEGTNRKGVHFQAVIQTPLVKRREMGCAGVFVDGTVQITRDGERTALLNYNPDGIHPAPCDRTASVTINGRTRTITLR